MLSKIVLFVLPIAALGSLSGGFNYDRCDAAFGPSNWPGRCQAQPQGTPINLCGATVLPKIEPGLGGLTTKQPRPVLSAEYRTPQQLGIYNDGASVGLSFPDTAPRPTLQIFGVSNLVGRSSELTYDTWVLQNIHVHWGRKDRLSEGSEHYLGGIQSAAEVHFVHYNRKYDNLTAAVGSGQSDALLVVGVFLQAGPLIDLEINLGLPLNLNLLNLLGLNLGNSLEPAFVKTITEAVATAVKTTTPLPRNVTLTDLVNDQDDFYTYAGSLTTPGCSEVVTWIVLKTPRKVRRESLQKLWQASTTPGQAEGELISEHGNYRPLQPLNGRTVYFTAGNEGPCPDKINEPDFGCSN